MRNGKLVLGLICLGLAAPVSGQTVKSLLKAGDTVIAMGSVNTATFHAINDAKTWMIQCTTSFPDATRDMCILSNGFVTLREGTALFAPAGAKLLSWNTLSMNNAGDLGMLIRVLPVSPAPAFDAVYWNLVPVAKKDQVVQSPVFPPPTPTIPNDGETFSIVKLNAKNHLFVMGEIIQGLTTRNKERSLVRYKLDDAGRVTETTVLATEGMTVPAGLRLLGQQCLSNDEHLLDVNDKGDHITMITADAVQWIVINQETAIAKKGTASPVGLEWREFAQGRVAINDRGDWVISGAIGAPPPAPGGYLIVKNGAKFAESGDVFPAVSQIPLGFGSQAPIYLANNGDVFWHARIGSTDSFMRNQEPIVIASRTIVDNQLVTSVLGGENGFAISPNGRFWMGSVQLQSVGTAILFADFGLALELPGCRGNQGKLTHSAGRPLLGSPLTLAMDRGQAPGAAAAIYFSRRSVLNANGCGVDVKPHGELMLGAPLLGHTNLGAWNGSSPITKTYQLPADIGLVDSLYFAQGVFVAPGHPSEPIRLTNALRIEFGAP